MNSQGEEAAAVRAVMELYADAVRRADVPALRRLFRPGASMNGYLGDEFLVGTPEPFFADLESRPSMAESGAPFKAEISGIQVAGRAASATLEETGFFGSGHFINYFHLLNVDGEWKLISKTFASL